LISGRWGTASGRRRRTYELTEAGHRALSGEREGWRDFSSVMAVLLGGRPWPAAP
jgi:PadR family transcriptional regulator, regulatory protein PadR